jgi:hypothetical protein
MAQIITIFSERPKGWMKGMQRINEMLPGGIEIQDLARRFSSFESKVSRLEKYSDSEKTVSQIVYHRITSTFLLIQRDMLKEQIYKIQKSCVCRFFILSRGMHDDLYICKDCGCKVEF